MAGLLKQQQQQGGGRPQAGGGGGGPARSMPGQPMPDQQQAGDEETNVSPEEQAEYDQFVTNGMKLMYSEETMPQVLKAIEGDGDPIEGLGTALATLVLRLEESAAENGREISGDVKINAATELLEQMADLAAAAGIHDYSPEDLESALLRGLDVYREIRAQQGDLPTEELSQDMAELMAADQEGRIDELVPGLSEYAQSRMPAGGAGQQPRQAQGGGQGGLLRRG